MKATVPSKDLLESPMPKLPEFVKAIAYQYLESPMPTSTIPEVLYQVNATSC